MDGILIVKPTLDGGPGSGPKGGMGLKARSKRKSAISTKGTKLSLEMQNKREQMRKELERKLKDKKFPGNKRSGERRERPQNISARRKSTDRRK